MLKMYDLQEIYGHRSLTVQQSRIQYINSESERSDKRICMLKAIKLDTATRDYENLSIKMFCQNCAVNMFKPPS